MPEQYGQAGRSTRQMAGKRRKQACLYCLFFIAAIVSIYALLNNASALKIGGGGMLVLLILMRVIPDIADRVFTKKAKEEKRAIRGARGEEKVGELVAGLGEDYLILHDIASPYGNIDHVAIGKEGGVFLIETKAHGGTVDATGERLLVNGNDPEKDFIRQTLSNTYWLRDEIEKVCGVKPWITPVLVFTNAFVKSGRPVKGVRVVNKKYLVSILTRENRGGSKNQAVWEKRAEIFGALE